jgi:anti-sigma28 factor (negative regulator of flagellin synthesis)
MAKGSEQSPGGGGKPKPVKSPRAQLSRAKKAREDRRIERIKRQIQEGAYETPEKLDIALERLIDDLGNYDEDGEPTRGDDSDGGQP